MSVRTMARVWADSKHSGTHLLMLLAIADFADDHGRAYPAVSTLAEKCRMTARNANLILSALRASGELDVRAGQGPRGTNVYRIALDEGLKTASGGVKKSSGVKPPSATPEAGFLPPCSRLPETPEAGFRQTISEPSVNHHEPKRVRAKRAARSPVKSSVPVDFVISEGVKTWAESKGFDRLQEHLEAFVGKAKAKGYSYADWDAAFMEAIRKDWAGLRGGQGEHAWRTEQRERMAEAAGPFAAKRSGRFKPASFTDIDYSEGVEDGHAT